MQKKYLDEKAKIKKRKDLHYKVATSALVTMISVSGALVDSSADQSIKASSRRGVASLTVGNIKKNSSKKNKIEKIEDLDSSFFEDLSEKQILTSSQKLSPNTDLKLEDGFYKVEISLYHKIEDKPSMGNPAMLHTANIVAKDGKYKMLIGSDKLDKKIGTTRIIASLVSFQVMGDDGEYHQATPYAFDLEIEGESKKRPKVFEFDITKKADMLDVMVDPKVKVMGNDPIPARLKIDWPTLNKVEEDGADLYKLKEAGTAKKAFNPNDKIDVKDGIMRYQASGGTFDKAVEFQYSPITGGKERQDMVKKLGRSTQFDMYEFKAVDNTGASQANKNPVTITIDLENGKNPKKAIYTDNSDEISLDVKDGKASIILNRLGKVAIINNEISSSKDASAKASKAVATGKTEKTTSTSSSSRSSTSSRRPSSSRSSSSSASSKKSNTSKSSSSSSSSRSTSKSSSSSNSSTNSTKSKESEKNTSKKDSPVTTLVNESNDFNEEIINEDINESDSNANQNTAPETEENLKIIFFGILSILASIAAATYVYIKVGKKLIYEIDLARKLRKMINKGDNIWWV